MKLKTLKRNTVDWLKKIAYNSNPVKDEYGGHCPNYATRCCLTCDRCWKNYHGKKY